MKLLVKVGDRFEFEATPMLSENFGIVSSISIEYNEIVVDHFGRKVFFDINGGLWSECGDYKRQTTIVDFQENDSSVSEKDSLEKEFNTMFLSDSLREQIFDTAKNYADISEDHPQANSLGLTLHNFYEELANIALSAYNEGHG